MSHIGNQKIVLPDGVSATFDQHKITVSGPKGTLELVLPSGIEVEQNGNDLIINRDGDSKQVRANHGLARALIANLVTGVSAGWSKKLIYHGVGYRAGLQADGKLELNVGFSHPVIITPPAGISLSVGKNDIIVSGIDKQLVGEIAAQIRRVRPPEPYKGKGIRYAGEIIKRKVGKTAAKTTA